MEKEKTAKGKDMENRGKSKAKATKATTTTGNPRVPTTENERTKEMEESLKGRHYLPTTVTTGKER
eukprot:2198717-Amphidinium_carterae.1